VFATVLVADAIILEASLSFINAGVQPPEPSWGNILADGQAVLLSGSWWPTFFPGLMILLTVLSLNVLSEGLTDALASPRVTTNADVASDEKSMARPGDEDAAVEAGAAGPVPDADPGRPELTARPCWEPPTRRPRTVC